MEIDGFRLEKTSSYPNSRCCGERRLAAGASSEAARLPLRYPGWLSDSSGDPASIVQDFPGTYALLFQCSIQSWSSSNSRVRRSPGGSIRWLTLQSIGAGSHAHYAPERYSEVAAIQISREVGYKGFYAVEASRSNRPDPYAVVQTIVGRVT